MPEPLIQKEPSQWPWCATAYLGALAVAALAVPAPEHCAGDWGFAYAAIAGGVISPLIDTVLIARRRRALGPAIVIGLATLVAIAAVLYIVVLLRGGAAHCFD